VIHSDSLGTHSLTLIGNCSKPRTSSTLLSVTMAEPVAQDQDAPQQASTEQNINPWSVSGEVGEDGKVKAIDYKKLTVEFGTSLIDTALLERFERVTGHKPHRFMRRQIVFSHRDLTLILDRFEKV
jgi:tryptophanyl-tRNA synthetase